MASIDVAAHTTGVTTGAPMPVATGVTTGVTTGGTMPAATGGTTTEMTDVARVAMANPAMTPRDAEMTGAMTGAPMPAATGVTTGAPATARAVTGAVTTDRTGAAEAQTAGATHHRLGAARDAETKVRPIGSRTGGEP